MPGTCLRRRRKIHFWLGNGIRPAPHSARPCRQPGNTCTSRTSKTGREHAGNRNTARQVRRDKDLVHMKMNHTCKVSIFGIYILGFGISSFAAVPPVIPSYAHPLPLSAVRLTGGPLKHAQDLDADYLLKLEPDRMLYHLRKRAGLEPKAQQGYGGWDADGRQLTGHICGHYLSAVSYMWAATGDPRFKERIEYIVSELKEIQGKQGDGYLGGLMGNARPPQRGQQNQQSELLDGKILFAQLAEGKILSGGFDLNGMWSPWYVHHKIFAGLRDAYRLAGNKTALEVETKFAAWAEEFSPDSRAQIQRMLRPNSAG